MLIGGMDSRPRIALKTHTDHSEIQSLETEIGKSLDPVFYQKKSPGQELLPAGATFFTN
jgi:hypothetical protein